MLLVPAGGLRPQLVGARSPRRAGLQPGRSRQVLADAALHGGEHTGRVREANLHLLWVHVDVERRGLDVDVDDRRRKAPRRSSSPYPAATACSTARSRTKRRFTNTTTDCAVRLV